MLDFKLENSVPPPEIAEISGSIPKPRRISKFSVEREAEEYNTILSTWIILRRALIVLKSQKQFGWNLMPKN